MCYAPTKRPASRPGAESEAEFFAVATECFFEKAAALERRHPALYAELRQFWFSMARHEAAQPSPGLEKAMTDTIRSVCKVGFTRS